MGALRAGGALVAGQIASAAPEDERLRMFDLLLTSFPHFVERFRALGVPAEYFRIGFDPRVLDDLGELPPEHPVVFVGALNGLHHRAGSRILARAAKDLPVQFWGYDLRGWPPWSPLRRRYNGEAWGIEMFRLLASARTVLNRHIGGEAGEYANNMRLFEATGVGSLLVTDAKTNLPELFEPGSEVVTYGTADELVAQVRRYLARRRCSPSDRSRRPGSHPARAHVRDTDAGARRDPRGLSPLIRPDLAANFAGARVLITGGLGFIGSNLARELVEMDATVVLVDSLVAEYGGLLYNVAGLEDRLTINISDVRDEHSLRHLVRGQEVLFNLAGQTSHLDSMTDPFTDLEITARSQLSILEACRYEAPGAKIVFASTRQIYGRPHRLPVDEGASDRAGRRPTWNQQDGRRVVPPALRRGVRLADVDPPSHEHATAHACACATRDRPSSASGFVAPSQARRSWSTGTAASCAISPTSTMLCGPSTPRRRHATRRMDGLQPRR